MTRDWDNPRPKDLLNQEMDAERVITPEVQISLMGINELKWHYRFLDLAFTVAKWSKDPSRKVGAVIVRPDRSICSLGYNGFARGVKDLEERYTNRDVKYELVVHAEQNAIISAREDLTGFTIYSTLMPCSRCTSMIINSGMKTIVTLVDDLDKDTHDNTKVRFDLTEIQTDEAGVRLIKIPLSKYQEFSKSS